MSSFSCYYVCLFQAYAVLYILINLLNKKNCILDIEWVWLPLQGVFDQRMKCWQKWQDAQVNLQKKREAEAKLQIANKPDKLQQAKDEIKEVHISG